jgi:predicted amidohydrolase
MRVAVTQFAAGEDKPANLRHLQLLVGQAADLGAELVVCPEASMHPFGTPDVSLAELAEPLDGPFVSGVAAAADRHGVTVVAGMFEASDHPARAYNTVIAVDSTGLVGSYRKLHLFDALGWLESKRLVPGELDGSALLTFWCGGLTVGVLTCYDIRFPELARALIDAGATLLAIPSAWVAGPLKEDQWLTLLRARAIENTCYVAAADQSPPVYAGRSAVVDPFGVPIAQLAEAQGIVVAEVSPDRLAEARRRMPSLAHRRFAVSPVGATTGSVH